MVPVRYDGDPGEVVGYFMGAGEITIDLPPHVPPGRFRIDPVYEVLEIEKSDGVEYAKQVRITAFNLVPVYLRSYET